VSAKDFFLTELPPLIAQWKEQLGPAAPKASFDVELEVEGEGMFSVVTKNGDATVRRGGVASPIVSLSFAQKTWDDALVRIIRPRLKQLAALDVKTLEAHGNAEMAKQFGGRKPVALEQALAAVKALPLRVVLAIEPAGGHKFEARFAGAEEDDPTITVQVAESDLEAIFSGALPPPQAFQQGKLKLKGAVSVAMALLARIFV
jgi:hypothetical protein